MCVCVSISCCVSARTFVWNLHRRQEESSVTLNVEGGNGRVRWWKRSLPFSNTSKWSWFIQLFEMLCSSSKYIIPEICTHPRTQLICITNLVSVISVISSSSSLACYCFCFYFYLFVCLLGLFRSSSAFCIKFWWNISTAEWVMGWNLCKHNNRKWRTEKHTTNPGCIFNMKAHKR